MNCMKELFKKDGKKAGLKDICEWWLEIYPEDIFISEPKGIIIIRDCCKDILVKLGKTLWSSGLEV